MDRKRITLLIGSLGGGGAEGVCVNVANGLVDLGWQVDLVVLKSAGSVHENRIVSGVNLVTLDVKHARYSSWAMMKYIHNNSPKLILAFNYELTVILVILRKLLRLKLSIVSRNINTMSHKRLIAKGLWRKYIAKPLIDIFYTKVDHVINQCEGMRKDLISIYPKLTGKTSVIYNPISDYVEQDLEYSISDTSNSEEYFLCIGRLEHQKAFHYAIKSFSLISKLYPGIRLKILGQGSLENDLRIYAEQLGVIQRVDFEGFQLDTVPFYINARATVLTSIFEGFPNVLLESIALGTPILAFDCPNGPREIVQDGKNGFLVRYKDCRAMSEAMENLLKRNWNRSAVSSTAVKFKNKDVINEYSALLHRFYELTD